MDISYIEIPALDIDKMKHFYGEAFGWTFEDIGIGFVSFSNAGIEGGFTKVYEASTRGGPLVVLKSKELAVTEVAIRNLGAEIVGYFDFPGGERFHFIDPTGNEIAVWFKADETPKT